jgi:hypothetical protein
MAPYRVPAPPTEAEAPTPEPPGLGAVRSRHRRTGVIAALAKSFELTVHVDGLTFIEGEGDEAKAVSIPFDEVDTLTFDFDRILGGLPIVTLTAFDGLERVIPAELTDVERVHGALHRGVTLPLAREAEEVFARGERLAFGPLVLHRNGIQIEESGDRLFAFVAWSDLEQVEIDRKTVVVHTSDFRGRVGWVRLAEVPHPRILVDLLRKQTRVVLEDVTL